jgi:ATP-binding cassette subfamily F protein 3
MLEARNLSLSAGTKVLLKNTSFRIGDKERVGLVGLNGTGKSTLLRLLGGEPAEDGLPGEGRILKSSGTSIGYLPQEISFEGDLEKNALQYALQADSKLFGLSQTIARLEFDMARPDHDHESSAYRRLIEDFSDASHEFERLGGYRMQSEAERILSGLGFTGADFQKKVREFSGGWQMRLLIARLLLRNPTLLLLDEPTNHLDIDSLRWMEQYLLNYEHSCVIVSHDRFFLDKLTTRTLEIAFQQITEYRGNYSFYEKEKAERYVLLMSRYQNDLKKLADMKSFVDRFRYKATKARQAQSRLRQMQKLEEELQAPEEDRSHISFRFPKANPSGREVMKLKEVSKSFSLPDGSMKHVLQHIGVEIMRGDRIAIVGSNGAGKSTFCKILAGQIDFAGRRETGHNVSLNYFSQHQTENLSPEKSVLEEMLDAAPTPEAQKKVRDILGCFLFSGDSVEKKTGVLSGGEKSRLALAKILLQASNLLIMDEPTNHLDMRSKEMLIDSLEQYDGTLLLVSHDRYFLDSLVNKVFEIRNGSLQVFLGTYAEYLEKSERTYEEERRREQAVAASRAASCSPAASRAPHTSAPAESRAARKKIEAVEREIHRIEEQKKQFEALMSSDTFYSNPAQETQKTVDAYHLLCRELDALYLCWEEALG